MRWKHLDYNSIYIIDPGKEPNSAYNYYEIEATLEQGILIVFESAWEIVLYNSRTKNERKWKEVKIEKLPEKLQDHLQEKKCRSEFLRSAFFILISLS